MLADGKKLGAFIVPTGIGASIGGFAGDASVYARKISQKCKLIVNPNVVNAACFSGINDNMYYVEGYSLDEFFKGKCNIVPSCNNKIGVVFDKTISKRVLNIHINTINAVKTVYGIDIIGYEITEKPVGVEFYVDDSAASTGDVKNLDTIKSASEKLIKRGAEAIAIVCSFPEDEGSDYANGVGVDPVGGVEAIISHYISKELKIPCAHAPAFENTDIQSEIVDTRCSAEYITPTFLPCILIGLNCAPKLSATTGINVKDIDFIVVPYNALGGIPVLEMQKLNKHIYAIKENKSVLDVTREKLGINCDVLNSYDELLSII
jgi:hypothetical protein